MKNSKKCSLASWLFIVIVSIWGFLTSIWLAFNHPTIDAMCLLELALAGLCLWLLAIHVRYRSIVLPDELEENSGKQ
ncbi:hypothetical protein JTE88_08275 [Arcanobacterium phocisimile]|uniref:Uncharacterized protein n=1 Tax=Arcanobacterium phocisimile TaxID=1302235 RepID=A0ABX7IH30_9ACTO|nr:hypothetical protein [Arcanobacterium phocisimile]QRV02055.1 hypothetical protein JTE88_08275 [Arcanobacterium phocisimile]